MVGQESISPVTTEQDVRESLQDLKDLFPQMRASTIYMFWLSVFLAFLYVPFVPSLAIASSHDDPLM